jgi:DNA-binding SARP family transcriptional activator
VDFRVLGPLEVRADDGPLLLGGVKQRALLALLLLNANRVVPRERLIDGLWGEEPPESAVKLVQLYVSQLRRLLPAGTIVTRAPGYALQLESESIDVRRFERLTADAQGGAPEIAAALLREALGLWRGPALADLDEAPFARLEAGRLEDLRLAALEERIEADLVLGRHAELVGELEKLIAERPHRERLRGQLMLALYRSGRQPEALQAYRDARAALDELGLAPGPGLRELERRILTQDAGLELVQARPLFSGPPPLPGPLVPEPPFPFVGREHELAALRAALDRAEGGEGGLALIAAEAGGGKTRLVRELARDAAGRGTLVLYGASDAAVTTPYQPVREWVEFLLRVGDDEVLRGCLGATRGSELARVAPELASLTGFPVEGAAPDRHSLHGAVTEFLARLGRVQPLLLVLDDLHWADGETLQLLRRLARSAPEARWLVVAAYRPEEREGEAAGALADLARLDGVRRVGLAGLGIDEVAEFIRGSTDAEAPAELAAAIEELSGGTPLFLCELWRELRESGAIAVGETVRLTRPLAELRGPERVSDLVEQRLARLDPETVALLELAAVAGPSFQLRLLAAAGLEQRRLLTAVEEALDAGVVEELPDSQPACRFSHELVRRAVYDRLRHVRRIQLHLQVGEALERIADPDGVLPELAHHFTVAVPLAGPERAVDYNVRAGHAAVAAGAYREAVARLETALELGMSNGRDRVGVQLELAFVRVQLGDRDGGLALVAASLETATALGEPALVARALLRRAHIEIGDTEADREAPLRSAAAAINTFTELGDARGLAEAWRLMGMALRRDGRCADALEAYERSLAHAREAGDAVAERFGATSISNVLGVGPEPVAAAIRRCQTLLQRGGEDREVRADLERCLSLLHAMAGRSDEALDLAGRSSAVLDELGHWETSWVHRNNAADARELAGDRVGAEHELVVVWRWWLDRVGSNVHRYAMLAAYRLALFYCDEGRWEEADGLLEYGREVPVPQHFLAEAVLGLAARARVAAHHGEVAGARALAQRAVELANQSDWLSLRARIGCVLAEVLRAGGETTQADTAIATALELYEQKGNVAAAARVRAAEVATGAPASTPRPSR